MAAKIDDNAASETPFMPENAASFCFFLLPLAISNNNYNNFIITPKKGARTSLGPNGYGNFATDTWI